jgi:diguanylate cyclase
MNAPLAPDLPDEAAASRWEWESLNDSIPESLRRHVAEIVAREAAMLTALFYDTLLKDPEAATMLSHELVSHRLSRSLQRWLLDLFPLDAPPEFAASARLQRRVGEVHARIRAPLHLVTRGARVLKGGIARCLSQTSLPRDELVETLSYASHILDLAMELMATAFIQGTERATRNEEAYRLFSLGQDASLEREAQRAALLEWLQSLLFAVAGRNETTRLHSIGRSEFGLWMQHRASVMFGGIPALQRITQLMREIDEEILPSIERGCEIGPALQRLQAHANDIKFLIGDAFQAVIGLENGRDALTRTLNRRFMPSIFAREIALAAQNGRGFAALMIDFDHFKAVNDTFGHSGGDVVLSRGAELIMDAVRLSDFVFRYGGEEFLVLLVEADANLAMRTAERIRATIEAAAFVVGEERNLRVTTSIGVAIFDGHPDYTHLVERADKALYAAKKAGRNRTILG